MGISQNGSIPEWEYSRMGVFQNGSIPGWEYSRMGVFQDGVGFKLVD